MKHLVECGGIRPIFIQPFFTVFYKEIALTLKIRLSPENREEHTKTRLLAVKVETELIGSSARPS